MCFKNEYMNIQFFFLNIEFIENPSAVCSDKPTSKKFLLHIITAVMYKSFKYARKQVYIFFKMDCMITYLLHFFFQICNFLTCTFYFRKGGGPLTLSMSVVFNMIFLSIYLKFIYLFILYIYLLL